MTGLLGIGILRECSGSEKRVALVPADVKKLKGNHVKVLVETGAGSCSFHPDSEYLDAGAEIVPTAGDVYSRADIISMLQKPSADDIMHIRSGQILVASFHPSKFPGLIDNIAKRNAVMYSMEILPRTAGTQSMDVLSSQSSASGYSAAIAGARFSPRFVPMLHTSSGAIRAASVLVIGAGVAGLMAVATMKRLGADVAAYDVRKAAEEEVRSLGADFIGLGVDAVGAGGYARDLTHGERMLEREILERAVQKSDIVICTAGVPGKTAPMMISREMVMKMKPGSVIVDTMADSGGNCELSRSDKVVDSGNVKIVGISNAHSCVPMDASSMHSVNVLSFISVLLDDHMNPADPERQEILNSCLVCRDGEIRFNSGKEGGNDS